MIRLYLKNYSSAECSALYNSLHATLLTLDKNTEPHKDIESVMVYLEGYIGCLHDNRKGEE
jgi:hypothetical protein